MNAFRTSTSNALLSPLRMIATISSFVLAEEKAKKSTTIDNSLKNAGLLPYPLLGVLLPSLNGIS